jgi:hypothetical protein
MLALMFSFIAVFLLSLFPVIFRKHLDRYAGSAIACFLLCFVAPLAWYRLANMVNLCKLGAAQSVARIANTLFTVYLSLAWIGWLGLLQKDHYYVCVVIIVIYWFIAPISAFCSWVLRKNTTKQHTGSIQ